MQRVYQIHVDQSNMVNEQGNMIDIIGEEMLKAQDNVEEANEQMIEASIQQKKSRKKCYILIFIILLIILLLGGVLFVIRPTWFIFMSFFNYSHFMFPNLYFIFSWVGFVLWVWEGGINFVMR